LKQAVQRNIESKRLSRHCGERLFRIGHESNLSFWIGLGLAIRGGAVRRYSHHSFSVKLCAVEYTRITSSPEAAMMIPW
jgi:hypothetical protein